MKTIKIGNASGYWGDDPTALYRQVMGGNLDYVTMDFLAEITMSIMQKQKSRNPQWGYARDFIKMMEDVMPIAKEKGTTIITNAGGCNPQACADALIAMAKEKGISIKVAVVDGDDILEKMPQLYPQQCQFQNMETGEDFAEIDEQLVSANIYFGANAVTPALKENPDIVVTGRVTDTGITLAAMIHEFGWSQSDWNKMASGIVAGHLMECGCQVTGGNFSDWTKVKTFRNIGYPYVEVSADGSFVLTKHEKSGGLVNIDTVREQLFYEMGNPKAYISPDVVADFSSMQVSEDGPNRIRVSGVKGCEPTPLYKVSMAYQDGYKNTGTILISGPNAIQKAEKFAEIFWDKWDEPLDHKETEYFGYNACHRSLAKNQNPSEIMLRLSARDKDQQKLLRFAKLIPSLILSGPPGVAVFGGVPKPTEVISYWPALMDKSIVAPKAEIIHYDAKDGSAGIRKTQLTMQACAVGNFEEINSSHIEIAESVTQSPQDTMAEISKGPHVRLESICLARSGDKGDTCNIGVLARSPEIYEKLKPILTAQLVKNLFADLCLGKVTRYELDNLYGFNFLLERSLGGGGTLTLRSDAQGKTFAQGLLDQNVPWT